MRGLGAETFMFDPTGLPWAGAKEMMRITEPKTSLFTSKPSDFAPPRNSRDTGMPFSALFVAALIFDHQTVAGQTTGADQLDLAL